MELKIFFDESGKKDNPPMLMGAISIPEDIYTLENINQINNELKDKTIKFHFTKYNGNRGEKANIVRLFNIFKPYLRTIRFNVLHYTKSNMSREEFDQMVYSKFPERVFYGLLRCKGLLMNINAQIFMEDATEYKNLPQTFKNQLNVQANYRGENFKIKECLAVPKNTEIGVEFTDIMLGIIRTIIESEKSSVTYKEKVNLVNELISLKEVYSFLTKIKYFEWDNNQFLKEIIFKDYLDAYVARNIDKIN